MRTRSTIRRIILFLGITILGISTFSAGFLVGSSRLGTTNFNLFSSSDSELNSLFQPYRQAWEIIHEQYLNQPVDDTELMRGSIRGLMDSLDDPYSGYMDPDEFEILNNPIKGEYTGIGAWVDTSGDLLVIISPMPESPAEEVGILPGDKVVGIEGEDVTGVNPEIVLGKILGPAGTVVTLTILREGVEELLEFEIERALIPIPSVESEILDDNIGYLRLYTFGTNSAEEVRNEITAMLNKGIDGLVFDLRNNTGGLVDASVEIVSIFLENDIVLIEEWPDGSRREYKTTKKPIAPDIPMIVLVNNGSASASEITAGALQDFNRAELVGTRTFGKGLIQNWIPLTDDNGAVRITIARWLTPNGRQIQDDGLKPDHIVELTEEDFEERIDRQLDKAIELLIRK
jgi:carboxyl-terminal processing protease